MVVGEEALLLADESTSELFFLKNRFGNFGKSSEEEEDGDEESQSGYGEVDELNIRERRLVSVGEEVSMSKCQRRKGK